MAPTDVAIAPSFDELAKLVDRVSSVEVRIRRADGTAIEGVIHNVDYVNVLFIEEHGGRYVEVPAQDLETLDVNVPRRGRELTLALLGVVVGTIALIGYAQLPWVPPRPDEGDMLPAFIALVAIGAGLSSIPPLRKWYASLFSTWRRIHPPVGRSESDAGRALPGRSGDGDETQATPSRGR